MGTMMPIRVWRKRAICKKGFDQLSIKEAKLICQSCPVAGECLKYALVHDEPSGVWGGFSRTDRIQIMIRQPELLQVLRREAQLLGILERRFSMAQYLESVRHREGNDF